MFISLPAIADTYLCVAEATAAVEHTDKGHIDAGVITDKDEGKKFIQTNDNGKLIVKPHGEDYVLFDKCNNLYFCERSDSYAGVFIREHNSSIFTITWLTGDKGRSVMAVAKGKCSKI